MADFIPARLYHQIIERMPIACVDVAIVAAGFVLLVKRRDAPARDFWWMPDSNMKLRLVWRFPYR